MSERMSWREILLKGHRTFPHVPWAATGRWSPSISTFLVLVLGLSLFGLGEGLLFITRLGNSPWVVLSEGLSKQLHMDLGLVNGLVSVGVLLLWIPLRERPGLGTILNIIIISAVLELVVRTVPEIHDPIAGIVVDVVAVLLVGLASALYLTTKLGPGPRDGLMTSLHNLTGIRVSRVRLSLEIVVLTTGYLLGGTIGIGTLIFALWNRAFHRIVARCHVPIGTRPLTCGRICALKQKDSMSTATIHTNHGDIVVNLFPNHAPKTVANFIGLSDGSREWTDPRTRKPGEGALYTNVPFHRVIAGFMIQGGDPLGTGTGGPGYTFEDEPHPELVFDKPYLLAMANAGPKDQWLTVLHHGCADHLAQLQAHHLRRSC